MNFYRIRITMTALALGAYLTLPVVHAHEPVDPAHAIPFETVDSRLAYPTEIHVQETEQGVEVKGKLKRKGHKNVSLRGHVDVKLLDALGRVLESETQPLRTRAGSAKHDHDRDFSVVLPLPDVKEYSVRVSHSIGGDKHE